MKYIIKLANYYVKSYHICEETEKIEVTFTSEKEEALPMGEVLAKPMCDSFNAEMISVVVH